MLVNPGEPISTLEAYRAYDALRRPPSKELAAIPPLTPPDPETLGRLVQNDLEDPATMIGVCDRWILQPEDPWEVTGYVHNVVFTCGAIPEEDGSVKIYWGGADKVMCVGTARIDELTELCIKDARPAL